jgi:hypothetical protein
MSHFLRRQNTITMLRSLRRGSHRYRERNSVDDSEGLAKYDLRHIFLATREFLAGDPRDKIYGVLGLTHRDSRKLITPNYQTDTVSVFCEAAMVLLKHERSTEAYTYLPVGRRKRFGEWFPSWIPNFAVAMDRSLPIRAGHLNMRQNVQQHRAGAEDIELLAGGRRIKVRGLLLDTVEYIVKAPPDHPQTNSLRTASQVVTAWVTYVYKFYNTPGPPLIRALLTLVSMVRMRARLIGVFRALAYIGKWPAWKQTQRISKESAWKLLLLSEANDDKYKDEAECKEKFNALIGIGRSFLRDESPKAWAVDPERLSISIQNLNLTDPILSGIMTSFVQGRYFFGCPKGWYGVGEGEVRVGDKLVLLFPDANMPFIFREKDGCYEMIGLTCVPEDAKNAAAASSDADFQSFVLV